MKSKKILFKKTIHEYKKLTCFSQAQFFLMYIQLTVILGTEHLSKTYTRYKY